VRGHDRALELGDMSPSSKAVTCHRTPKWNGVSGWGGFGRVWCKWLIINERNFENFLPWTVNVHGCLL
jgi:hypothetical protein